MGLFSGLTKIATANSTKKNQKSLQRNQQFMQRIENFQRKRSMLKQFRQLQGQAQATNIAAGAGLDSSLGLGLMASQGAQARTNVIENALQQHSQERIFQTSGKIARNQGYVNIAGAADQITGSLQEVGGITGIPSYFKKNIWGG